ncbi:MAG: hypothetical protein GSR86_07685 [Desulfurococcales archaeon]|nr:hypothetical protein [Desulfurococcales archaeon]
MVEGAEPVHRDRLLGLAMSLLKPAWIDLYNGSYEWVIAKAHHAASAAMDQAPGRSPKPLPLLALELGCIGEDLLWELQWLDYTAALALNPLVRYVLGWDDTMPSRGDALRAIEAVLRTLNALNGCGWGRREVAPSLTSRYIEYGRSAGATVVVNGYNVVVVRDEYSRVKPLARIDVERGRIPVGLTPILLAPDEVLALLSVPGVAEWVRGGVLLHDELGLSLLL